MVVAVVARVQALARAQQLEQGRVTLEALLPGLMMVVAVVAVLVRLVVVLLIMSEPMVVTVLRLLFLVVR